MRYLNTITPIYFIVLAIEIYASSTGNKDLMYATKPWLMPILLLLFSLNAKDNLKTEKIFFPLGLLFSLSGDVFLMLPGKINFIIGLLSFLVAHICYIISFASRVKAGTMPVAQRIIYALPFALYVFMFLYFLYPHFMGKPEAQSLFLPVAIYGCVIGTMSYMAFLRRKAITQMGFLLVFVGSLFFIASDSSLSTAIFVGQFQYSELAIMVTYGLAQYLLTVGTLRK